ncbi:MAG: hypothetical protein IJ466_11410 [Clostridia bacterium]|nr:hypothetical protein [Clostridia bacterium]
MAFTSAFLPIIYEYKYICRDPEPRLQIQRSKAGDDEAGEAISQLRSQHNDGSSGDSPLFHGGNYPVCRSNEQQNRKGDIRDFHAGKAGIDGFIRAPVMHAEKIPYTSRRAPQGKNSRQGGAFPFVFHKHFLPIV